MIFKGGVTWPAACFEFLFAYSGTSGNPIYIGVDQSWYTGGSWTRPIWDGQLTAPTGGEKMFEVPTANGNVTLDNIEVVHYLVTNTNSGCEEAAISGRTAGAAPFAANFIVENVYNHDWGFLASAQNAPAPNMGISADHNAGSICSATLALNDTADDVNGIIVGPGTHLEMGACFKDVMEVSGGVCHDTADGDAGYIGPGGIHGVEFYNINQAQFAYSETHPNVIENLGVPSPGAPIYDNLIHDNSAGETVAACYNDPIYNNVLWNNGAGSDINPGYPNGQPCSTSPSTVVEYVVNNTIDCTLRGGACLRINAPIGTLYLQNNHLITNQNNQPAITYDNCMYGCPKTIHADNNPIQTSAQAAAQGYNPAGKYAPSSSSGITVTTAGDNLASACSLGGLTSLCFDASGAPWYGGSYISRTNSTGGTPSWGIGAYVMGGSSSSSKPEPPSGLTAVVQ
jgi:hypothetical protein